MASLDEEHLDLLLSGKVHGARVVRIIGQGFWALIPHYRNEPGYGGQFTLASQYLGEDYHSARKILQVCWDVRE